MWPANSRTAPAASRSRLCRSTDPRRLPTPTNSTRVLARESAQQVVEANIVPYPSTPPVLSPQLWFTSTLACTRPSHMDPSPGTAMRTAFPGSLSDESPASSLLQPSTRHARQAFVVLPNHSRPSGLHLDKHDSHGNSPRPGPTEMPRAAQPGISPLQHGSTIRTAKGLSCCAQLPRNHRSSCSSPGG